MRIDDSGREVDIEELLWEIRADIGDGERVTVPIRFERTGGRPIDLELRGEGLPDESGRQVATLVAIVRPGKRRARSG